ncbi:lactonase family protein [Colwelliaceae bacterium 6471]
MYLIKFTTLLFTSLLVISNNVVAITLEIKQVLKDGNNSIDGLDNPRQVKFDPSGQRVFVTSGDDNSLLILEFDGALKPRQLFKNKDDKKKLLEGASALVTYNNGKNIAVASFYDSSLSLYEKGPKHNFNFKEAYSDNVSYERIFKSDEPLANEDHYGLFGAWDIAISSDEKQIYVASYKSNAISIFDLDEAKEIGFNSKYIQPSNNTLGNPTSIILSKSNKELIVAGFENNSLSVLSRDKKGELISKQRIKNGVDGVKNLVNPQKVILSPNGKYLYVACSGSNAVVIFESKNNRYTYLQSVTHSETGGMGLTGVGSLALTNDGAQLFAAGELDKGLLMFDVRDDGSLKFNRIFQPSNNRIEGVTSIAITSDGKKMLLTLGKMDALYLLELGDGEI